MPMLTLVAKLFAPVTETPFNLIFPLLNVFAVILAVITFNYVSADGASLFQSAVSCGEKLIVSADHLGKTNYFVGTSMLIMYLLFIAAFFFAPESALV